MAYAKSADPYQTGPAPEETVCSESTLLAFPPSILRTKLIKKQNLGKKNKMF